MRSPLIRERIDRGPADVFGSALPGGMAFILPMTLPTTVRSATKPITNRVSRSAGVRIELAGLKEDPAWQKILLRLGTRFMKSGALGPHSRLQCGDRILRIETFRENSGISQELSYFGDLYPAIGLPGGIHPHFDADLWGSEPVRARRTRRVKTRSENVAANGRSGSPDVRPPMEADELWRFKISKDFLKTQLCGQFAKLVRELTGLQLHVLWHEAISRNKSGGAPKLCPKARNGRNRGRNVDPTCEACLERDWKPNLGANDDGFCFVGSCGLTTFRVAIETDGAVSPVSLAIQASVRDGNGKLRSDVPMADFEHGIALLRLIKRHLEVGVRATTAEIALERLKRRLPALKNEAKLVSAQKRHLNARLAAIGTSGGGHGQRIVQKMVEHVHEHFQRPMSLSQVAATMKMNAAYLSDLFSRQVGMTFHHYLLEVRMAKARQLLLDPHRRINEVAVAVGYASADQFRHAFKTHAGVPPSEWR